MWPDQKTQAVRGLEKIHNDQFLTKSKNSQSILFFFHFLIKKFKFLNYNQSEASYSASVMLHFLRENLYWKKYFSTMTQI